MTQEKPTHPDEIEVNGTQDAAADADTPEVALQEQLDQARAEATENLDNFLRAKAETENVRKRAADDVIKARKFAVEQFAGELLAVRDSLELASQVDLAANSAEAMQKMHEGVSLTLKQLDSAFEKSGIAVLDPTGEKFNPELHQAMSMVETTEVEPNHVVSVLQKGYVLNERLLRPAMVVVAKAPAQTADTGGGEA
ncbi:MAG: nucleotide exchange factor GrpE [Acidiferrobacterales bacterium]|jgi:molecular chaperone GrpE|nr:nucleotide exchange factor GrpE [Acidiferrobacterales bacterium]